jgi:hypothetical protein
MIQLHYGTATPDLPMFLGRVASWLGVKSNSPIPSTSPPGCLRGNSSNQEHYYPANCQVITPSKPFLLSLKSCKTKTLFPVQNQYWPISLPPVLAEFLAARNNPHAWSVGKCRRALLSRWQHGIESGEGELGNASPQGISNEPDCGLSESCVRIHNLLCAEFCRQCHRCSRQLSYVRVPNDPSSVFHMKLISIMGHPDLRIHHIGKLSGILRYDYEPGHLTVFCVVK